MNKIFQFVFVYLVLVLCIFALAKRVDTVNKYSASNTEKTDYYQSSLVKNY